MDIVKMRSTRTPLQFLTYEIGGEEGIMITEGKEEISEDDFQV